MPNQQKGQMMKETEKAYQRACDKYAEYGVDVSSALLRLDSISIAIHAWQGDDVVGFERNEHSLTGGCQVTGNYPGRARTADELRADLEVALKLIPGRHRVCLQAHQVDRMFNGVDRDGYGIEHFSKWMDWAEHHNLKMDIAPAFYSHKNLDNGMSLSHPDRAIRQFWINHGKSIRRIAAKMGKKLGAPSICNIWVPDGFKDTPADRQSPRLRLQDSLDEIFADTLPHKYLRDSIESKLFGIGVESYTVGSHDFCLGYTVKKKKLLCLDTGHFHPTESIADKLSAVMCHLDEILLHISRGVRWDSDHVPVLNDELISITQESVRYDYLKRINFCLDYFDASINRVAAWVIGVRNMRKALLNALLEPHKILCDLENKRDFTGRLALQEEAKMLPLGAVWEYYCLKSNVPPGFCFMDDIRKYESRVLMKRE
ncbi:MAG: L-rhamnose isomerase [bacterium]